MHWGEERPLAGQRGRALPRGRNLGRSAQVWRTQFLAKQESGPPSYQSSLFCRKQTTWLMLWSWRKVGEEFVFHRVDIQVAKVKTQSSNSGAQQDGGDGLGRRSGPGGLWEEVAADRRGGRGAVSYTDPDRLRRQKAMRSEGLRATRS